MVENEAQIYPKYADTFPAKVALPSFSTVSVPQGKIGPPPLWNDPNHRLLLHYKKWRDFSKVTHPSWVYVLQTDKEDVGPPQSSLNGTKPAPWRMSNSLPKLPHDVRVSFTGGAVMIEDVSIFDCIYHHPRYPSACPETLFSHHQEHERARRKK